MHPGVEWKSALPLEAVMSIGESVEGGYVSIKYFSLRLSQWTSLTIRIPCHVARLRAKTPAREFNLCQK